jgi:hypothetical protein
MRIVPLCEAIVGKRRCRESGIRHLTVTHPKRPVQTADLCAKHVKVVAAKAIAEGYEVNITG